MLSFPLKQTENTKPYFSKWDRNLLSLTHELSGPLSAARINLDLYQVTNSLASLELLEANLKLMEDYLNTTRQHIKRRLVPARVFTVNRQLEDITKNLIPLAHEGSVTIELKAPGDSTIRGNATRFKQIISCFIRNGIEAYDNSAYLQKTVTIETCQIKNNLVIKVSDQGSGIAEADKTEIFKPYYSTKQASSGLGLGLSLAAESLHEDFNGWVEVDSRPSGTEFRLFFRL